MFHAVKPLMYSYVGMGQLLLAAMCSVCSEQATDPSSVGFLLACFCNVLCCAVLCCAVLCCAVLWCECR
jgi:hypothetical protein